MDLAARMPEKSGETIRRKVKRVRRAHSQDTSQQAERWFQAAKWSAYVAVICIAIVCIAISVNNNSIDLGWKEVRTHPYVSWVTVVGPLSFLLTLICGVPWLMLKPSAGYGTYRTHRRSRANIDFTGELEAMRSTSAPARPLTVADRIADAARRERDAEIARDNARRERDELLKSSR